MLLDLRGIKGIFMTEAINFFDQAMDVASSRMRSVAMLKPLKKDMGGSKNVKYG